MLPLLPEELGEGGGGNHCMCCASFQNFSHVYTNFLKMCIYTHIYIYELIGGTLIHYILIGERPKQWCISQASPGKIHTHLYEGSW